MLTPVEAVDGRRQDARRGLPRLLQYGIVALVVGLWIGLGYLLRTDPNAYLLLGMPITVLFQALVARRPLRELWLRHGQPLRFDRWTAAWLLLFLAGPVQTLVVGVRSGDWPVAVYGAMAILGAGGAALAFRVLGASSFRWLGLVLVISFLRLPLQLVVVTGSAQHLALGARLWTQVQSLLFYVPAVFVAEEVFFRGALDSYLHRDEPGAGWASAAFVSVLWGFWHTPVVGHLSMLVVLELVGAQLVFGLILSWFWRRTGNLAVPGTVHAISDALRNALLL